MTCSVRVGNAYIYTDEGEFCGLRKNYHVTSLAYLQGPSCLHPGSKLRMSVGAWDSLSRFTVDTVQGDQQIGL